MPIIDLKNGITELRRADNNALLMMVPTQLLNDLRSAALVDGLKMAGDDKWLVKEIRLNGDPDVAAGRAAWLAKDAMQSVPDDWEYTPCWNCGDTLAFIAPTGDRDAARFHTRPDADGTPVKSPLHRKWREYPCPACQNPRELLREHLRLAGIIDPERALAQEIWWGRPYRLEMERGVQGFISRMVQNRISGTLTLVGPYGCGKSTLSEHIVVECKRASLDVLYVTAERFKEAAMDAVRSDDGDSPYLKRVRSAPIVVMDQLDWIRESTSTGQPSYTAEVFRDVFDHRYRMRNSCATVYVVNLDAWQQAGKEMLSAIYDRMKEGEVYTARNKETRQEIGEETVRVYGQETYDMDEALT